MPWGRIRFPRLRPMQTSPMAWRFCARWAPSASSWVAGRDHRPGAGAAVQALPPVPAVQDALPARPARGTGRTLPSTIAIAIRRGERHATARVVTLADPVWRQHWQALYAGLVARKGISGLQAFSNESFDRLAELPPSQLTIFVAEAPDGAVLAMQIMGAAR